MLVCVRVHGPPKGRGWLFIRELLLVLRGWPGLRMGRGMSSGPVQSPWGQKGFDGVSPSGVGGIMLMRVGGWWEGKETNKGEGKVPGLCSRRG